MKSWNSSTRGDLISSGGSGENLEFTVTQASHGLAVQDAVRVSSGSWIKAQADDIDTLATHVVIAVSGDDITLCSMGKVTLTAHGLTTDNWYFLSDITAGLLTSTAPDIQNPLLYVEDANTVHIVSYLPVDTTSGGGSGGGGLSNIVEDTTPQLGGMLDVNGFAIGDGTNELLTFVEDASAANNIEIENEAAGSGPILRVVGSDTDIDLNLIAKGTGGVIVPAGAVATPGLILSGDSDTGIYSSAANQIGFSVQADLGLVINSASASAVNYFQINNSIATNGPELIAAGTDTDIDVEVIPKGTGATTFGGTNAIVAPSGTTAQRVDTNGAVRYNSTTSKIEGHEGGEWIDLGSNAFISAFKNGSQATTGAYTDITAWTADATAGFASINTTTGVVTFNQACTCMVMIDIRGTANTGNRTQLDMQMQLDTGGGFVAQARQQWSNYTSRNATQDEGGIGGVFIMIFNNGDDIKFQMRDVGTPATVATDDARIYVMRIG